MLTTLEILKILDKADAKLDTDDTRLSPLKYAVVAGGALKEIRETCERALPPSPEELTEVLKQPPTRPQLASDYYESISCEQQCEEYEFEWCNGVCDDE